MFLKPYKDMFPDAQVIGVEGLPERKKEEGLTFDFVFDKNTPQKSFGPDGEVCIIICHSNGRLKLNTSLVILTKKSYSSTSQPEPSSKPTW
jgi:hypothetical protein